MNQINLDGSFECYLTNPDGTFATDPNGKKIRIAQDIISGGFYAKIADQLPTDKDAKSLALLDSIEKQNPIHSATLGGWWIPVNYQPLVAAK